jgi:hypothetical protein
VREGTRRAGQHPQHPRIVRSSGVLPLEWTRHRLLAGAMSAEPDASGGTEGEFAEEAENDVVATENGRPYETRPGHILRPVDLSRHRTAHDSRLAARQAANHLVVRLDRTFVATGSAKPT